MVKGDSIGALEGALEGAPFSIPKEKTKKAS